jgi:hypothetical protein
MQKKRNRGTNHRILYRNAHKTKKYGSFVSGLFQEKIPGRVGTPLIFFYLGGGRKTYFFSGGCCQISRKRPKLDHLKKIEVGETRVFRA